MCVVRACTSGSAETAPREYVAARPRSPVHSTVHKPCSVTVTRCTIAVRAVVACTCNGSTVATYRVAITWLFNLLALQLTISHRLPSCSKALKPERLQTTNPTFRAVALPLASLEPFAPLEQVGHVLASEGSIELEGRAQLLEGLACGPRVDDLHAILFHLFLVFCQQQRP